MTPTPPATKPATPAGASEGRRVAVVGAGPAGLMAAEVLVAAGIQVDLYDAMPSAGRKFLLAGIGGLNLTHAEDHDRFVARYASRAPWCGRWLEVLGPKALREWARGLGINTFVGSSQRVFPTDMKAAPLLRAWLHRLRHPSHGLAARFHMRHRWSGGLSLEGGQWRLAFDTAGGQTDVRADVVVLALGGGSWARLGSDGAWVPWLSQQGVAVAPLRPSNCGFDVRVGQRMGWSEHFASRFAGHAFKSARLVFTDSTGQVFDRKGEFVATTTGIEGSLVYAASAALRDAIEREGGARVYIDLRPDLSHEQVLAQVAHPRGARSMSSHLKSRLGLGSLHTVLLHELLDKDTLNNPHLLAQAIKQLPLDLAAARPLNEAISTAGGVALEALDDKLMCRALPGVFCAGEMLDWEAPTGGYLLNACMASGRVAGQGALAYLDKHPTGAASQVGM